MSAVIPFPKKDGTNPNTPWLCSVCRKTRLFTKPDEVPSSLVVCGECGVSAWKKED